MAWISILSKLLSIVRISQPPQKCLTHTQSNPSDLHTSSDQVNISKGAITKSTAVSYTCLMGPTEPLGYQLYGRAPAKAITKSLHCFTHFLRHSDGSWGTVTIAVEVSCITDITRGKQKAKEKKWKRNEQILSIKCTWMAPRDQIAEGITPHLGITITCHARNPGVRLAFFSQHLLFQGSNLGFENDICMAMMW